MSMPFGSGGSLVVCLRSYQEDVVPSYEDPFLSYGLSFVKTCYGLSGIEIVLNASETPGFQTAPLYLN